MSEEEQNFSSFDELEAHYLKSDAFDPEELFTILKIKSITGVPMPERMLEARNVDFNSAEFKEIFPNGVPCIQIATEGVDVEFDFGEGNVRNIIIEMVNFQGDNIGKPKKEGSKLHITNQAFEDVLGHPLFGADNRKALEGAVVRFGQHMGNAKIDGDTRRWRWDVPREDLGKDFVYTGEVRKITGRAQSEAKGGASAGVEELSDEDGLRAVLAVAVGRPAEEGDAITSDVMAIEGLPQKWAASAMEDNLLADLYKEGYVDSAGGLVVATDKAKDEGLVAEAAAAS